MSSSSCAWPIMLTLLWLSKLALGEQFPKLPPAFSTIVEANIVNRNYTAIMSEVYDSKLGKSYRGFTASSLRGNTINVLEMFNLNQQWTWETSNTSTRPQKCVVTQTMPFEFDLHNIRGTPSVNQFFKNTSSTMMNGTAVVRGIPCEVWVQNTSMSRVEGMVNVSLTYNTYYYFSMEPWTWFRPESRIPTRVIVRGSHVEKSSNTSLNDAHSFEHYYEFIKFEETADFSKVSTAVTSVDTHLCDVSSYCANATNAMTQFCSVYRGPKMPPIDPTFSTNVEMNFLTRNMTLNSFEAFDDEHKLLHMRSTTDENHTHYLLADMTGKGEVWEWDTKIGMTRPVECQVSTLQRATNPTVELFRHSHGGGPYYSRDFFTFGGAMVNETYIGQSVVRGIPVDGWYRYIVQNASAFHPPFDMEEFRMDVFYYFSRSVWTYPPRPTRVVPVRIEVKGVAVDVADPAHSHKFDHVYDYYDFRSGHDYADLSESFNHDPTHNEVHVGHAEEHEFLPPIDWIRQGFCNTTAYCTNNPTKRTAVCTPAPRTMPQIPSTFSTHVEANFIDKNYTTNVFEAFDDEHKVYHQRRVGKADTHRLLSDLTTNETWLWDTKNEFGDSTPLECVVTTAKKTSDPQLRELFFHGHEGHVYSSSDFFKFGTQSKNAKYVGEAVIRGIPVQVWSSKVLKNMTALHAPFELEQFDFEVFYYFSDPSKWKYGHLIQTNKMPVPVRVHVKGKATDLDGGAHGHTFEHIYEYSMFRAGHNESMLEEAFNHDKTHDEMHTGHDEAHEFLPPIDWVKKNHCNTTEYCTAGGNPRKDVCSPQLVVSTTAMPQQNTTSTLSAGSSGKNSCECKNDQTAAIVVGVVLGVLLLAALGVIFYLYNSGKGGPTFGRSMSDSQL